MKRHQFDGDVRNIGRIRREASSEPIEIGQPAGIEFGIDSLGEFGLTGALMS